MRNTRCSACGCRWAPGGPTTDEAPCPWCGHYTGQDEDRRRPGRPTEYGHRVVLAIRIPTATRTLLTQAAKDGDVGAGRLASHILAQWLEAEGYGPPAQGTLDLADTA